MTVRADIDDGTQPLDVVQQILPTLDGIRAAAAVAATLLETGGTVEDSARGQNSIKRRHAAVPVRGGHAADAAAAQLLACGDGAGDRAAGHRSA